MNYCEDEQWQDAPFCSGDSDQGSAPCPIDAMSARGYCPHETEGHVEELESLGIEVVPTEQEVTDTDTTLPETGFGGVFTVLPLALAAIVTGIRMVR